MKVKINEKEINFRCEFAFCEKLANSDSPAIKLKLQINKDNKKINWQEFKGSYLAEKISCFIKNTINGQESFYWDSNLKKKDGK